MLDVDFELLGFFFKETWLEENTDLIEGFCYECTTADELFKSGGSICRFLL